ncbi:MAG: hypothetical protein JOZ78_23855 [Chroococcidiopsidaceae cyanobacterium CP_BM_ER_R8_30]|nr:hypothetical protein [Chroococcidiopsidaceae cyanobacterium CP_BM_ER_R8_30]
MKRDTLTLLGCSGSLAFMMLTGNAANASTIPTQDAGFGPTATTTQTVKAAFSQGTSQFSALDLNSDRIGDLAIAKFGCDCPSCRNKIVSMIQNGTLTLPN